MALFLKPDTVRVVKQNGTTVDIDGLLYGMEASVAFYMTDRVPEAPNVFMCDYEDKVNFTVNDRVEYISHKSNPVTPIQVFKVAKPPKNYPADDISSSSNVFLSEEGYQL